MSPPVGTSSRSRRLRMKLAGQVLRRLPAPVLGSVLRRGAQGGKAVLPPFGEFVALLEGLGPAAERVMDQHNPIDLVARFPELATVTVRHLRLGPAGVPARVYRHPDKPVVSALVWVHGGAYVSGSLDMHESHWVGLALAARGIPVLALDYRKALHGVRYPVPRDDVLAGWHWAVENSTDALGTTADTLHLGGASAGGNLVATATRHLLDQKQPTPRTLILAYASLHSGIPDWDPAELAAIREATDGTSFEPHWLTEKNLHYAGPDHMNDPAAFAGLGDPLPGHPPTLFLDCENDTVRPSADLFARQLTDAGLPCERHLLTGASHGSLDRPESPDGQEALEVLAKWIEVRP
ncbi:alpha/beta hydrolase [Streptomyces sp. DSM 15324]|uniref:alpha/beta hydrolase n=1 Tax=Streptomyces sp. DSM 15324 TaxID=1739111 RepID=UPI000ACBA670|nr:alpha/beta hydrolase [Streptomyces sp. DSM 15324]